jgi:hypothetical protein
MSQLNREWHLSNRMPRNASLDERIAWHVEHAQNCTCREMPPKIAAEIARLGSSVASPAARKP